MTHKKIVKRKQ